MWTCGDPTTAVRHSQRIFSNNSAVDSYGPDSVDSSRHLNASYSVYESERVSRASDTTSHELDELKNVSRLDRPCAVRDPLSPRPSPSPPRTTPKSFPTNLACHCFSYNTTTHHRYSSFNTNDLILCFRYVRRAYRCVPRRPFFRVPAYLKMSSTSKHNTKIRHQFAAVLHVSRSRSDPFRYRCVVKCSQGDARVF